MEQPESFQLSGYYPGFIGKVTESHADYYHRNWGFDISFEIQVGRELSDFMQHFNPARDGVWAARCGGDFAGSIVVNGRLREREGARIRWFIVRPEFQGKGLGGYLLRQAIDFCVTRKEIVKVFLWTFKGLNAAKQLYEREGFHLVEERVIEHWGTVLSDQKMERLVDG